MQEILTNLGYSQEDIEENTYLFKLNNIIKKIENIVKKTEKEYNQCSVLEKLNETIKNILNRVILSNLQETDKEKEDLNNLTMFILQEIILSNENIIKKIEDRLHNFKRKLEYF